MDSLLRKLGIELPIIQARWRAFQRLRWPPRFRMPVGLVRSVLGQPMLRGRGR